MYMYSQYFLLCVLFVLSCWESSCILSALHIPRSLTCTDEVMAVTSVKMFSSACHSITKTLTRGPEGTGRSTAETSVLCAILTCEAKGNLAQTADVKTVLLT